MQTEQRKEGKPLSAADKKFMKEIEDLAKDIEKQEKKAKKKNKKNKQNKHNDNETQKQLELDDDYPGTNGTFGYMVYALNKASVEEDKRNNTCCIIL